MEWNYHKILAQVILEKYENEYLKVTEISNTHGIIDTKTLKELEKLRSNNG